MGNYDPHELKIIRRGVSIEKVIAAYKHFGSLRKAAHVCGISKDTVKTVILRFNVKRSAATLPSKASYNPRTHYSDFAKWHQAHAEDSSLPHSVSGIARLSGANPNVVKCYFYRRRREVQKLLASLPDLRRMALKLQDIEDFVFETAYLKSYRYAIDRYSQKAALQGTLASGAEVTVLIPSINVFASRVKKLAK